MMADQNSAPVALVTGGAGGIGQAMTRALIASGIRVGVMDIARDRTSAFTDKMNTERGADVTLPIIGSIAEEADCDRAVSETIVEFGSVDVLINNAGVGMSSLRPDAERNLPGLLELTPEVWRNFFAVNTTGAFLMARAALPHMQARGWGRIINNTTSFHTMLRSLPYGASKAALESASAVWAAELAAYGVTVNVLVPGGPTDTPFIADESEIDRAKMIKPEVMGAPAAWLASRAADGVTGKRFVAALWDTSVPPEQAAEAAGAPIGWPELARNVVWPDD